jgi:hypothetical protein
MGGGVAPIIQMSETGQPDRVRWVGPCEIDQEAKPSEILADVIGSRVSCVELELGSELGLNGCPQAGRHGGSAKLRAE